MQHFYDNIEIAARGLPWSVALVLEFTKLLPADLPAALTSNLAEFVKANDVFATLRDTKGSAEACQQFTRSPEYRVLCGVSTANMGSVVLPPQLGTVVLLADNDGMNQAAARGLARAVNHFVNIGRQVRLARSPWGSDFNDALMAGA